ncbi:M48 family metalloprotease [Candidatus Margulisiibacteriota bacterium]
MKQLTKILLIIITAFIVLGGMTGCTTNPLTGQRNFNIVSDQEEVYIGKQVHKQIKAQFGLYEDKEMQTYVYDIGQRLVNVSDRKEIKYHFYVLDSPIINAFAVPGGYIYVTRGAMTEINTEAELAAVLGHELGHVTARHGAQKLSQARAAQGGMILASIFAKDVVDNWGGLINVGINLAILGYGRENELESDQLGVIHAYRAGWHPNGMEEFLITLQKKEDHDPSNLEQMLQSHPATKERIQFAKKKRRQVMDKLSPEEQQQLIVKEDDYKRKINGIVYGPGKKMGELKNNTYKNYEYGINWTIPSSWKVQKLSQNEINALLQAEHNKKTQLFLQTVQMKDNIKLEDLTKAVIESRKATVKQQVNVTIGGHPAQLTDVEGGSKYPQYRIYTMIVGKYGYIFTYFNQTQITYDDFKTAVINSLQQFKIMNETERQKYAPKKLQIYTIKSGDTFTSISTKFYGTNKHAKKLAIFNGYNSETDKPKTGMILKIPPL